MRFLLKNLDFLIKIPDFLIKNLHHIILKTGLGKNRVGEEDHLRIMCMFKGTMLNDVFDRLSGALLREESSFPNQESSFSNQESSFPNQESSFFNIKSAAITMMDTVAEFA